MPYEQWLRLSFPKKRLQAEDIPEVRDMNPRRGRFVPSKKEQEQDQERQREVQLVQPYIRNLYLVGITKQKTTEDAE